MLYLSCAGNQCFCNLISRVEDVINIKINFEPEMPGIAVTKCVMSTGFRNEDGALGGFLR